MCILICGHNSACWWPSTVLNSGAEYTDTWSININVFNYNHTGMRQIKHHTTPGKIHKNMRLKE